MGTCGRTNRWLAVAAGAGLAVAALVAVWIALRLGGARTALWVDDASTPAAAGFAFVLCLRAAVRHRARMRRFWNLLALATGCWAIAELLWGLYPLILHRPVPSVSAADVFYLLAVPLALAALYVHPAVHGGRPGTGGGRTARLLFDGVVVATAILFVSWTLVLAPLWRTTDFSTAEGLIGLAYPFGDIVIVFFCVLAIRRLAASGDRRPLWFPLAGLIALAVSDSAYSYLTAAGIYGYRARRPQRRGCARPRVRGGRAGVAAVAPRPPRAHARRADHRRGRDQARAPPRHRRLGDRLRGRRARARPSGAPARGAPGAAPAPRGVPRARPEVELMSRPAYTVAPAGEDRIGRARSGDRAQEHAFIVVVLTIACTALAIFDLLLLVTTG